MGGGGGGPWDFSVSPSPFGLDFGTLALDLTKMSKHTSPFKENIRGFNNLLFPNSLL